jgi:pilus assembly protein CpaF
MVIIAWGAQQNDKAWVTLQNKLTKILSGITEEQVYFTTSKDDVDDKLNSEPVSALIVSEKLGDVNIGVGTIRTWRKKAEGLRVILVAGNDKYCSGKFKGLYDSEYYDALMARDFTGSAIRKLFAQSRTEDDAYDYYGLANYKDLLTEHVTPISEQPVAENTPQVEPIQEETAKEEPSEEKPQKEETAKAETKAETAEQKKPAKSQETVQVQETVRAPKKKAKTDPDEHIELPEEEPATVTADMADTESYLKHMEHEAFGTPRVTAPKLSKVDLCVEDLLTHYTKEDPTWISNLEKNIASRDAFEKELRVQIAARSLNGKEAKEAFDNFSTFMWGYDIIEPLIEDSTVSDIKMYEPYLIRIKQGGIRKTAEQQFRTVDHYKAFVNHLAKRNHVSIQDGRAICAFTDSTSSEEARLRINVSTEYVNSNCLPCVQIRKVPNNKYTTEELIRKGMFDATTAAYLIRQARNDSGIVFTGKGSAGKTTVMNWLIDYIPHDKSGLVIQEADELFSKYHPDICFQHITSSPDGGTQYDLKRLGINGLLTDIDYFIIGEIKGAEAKYFLNAAYTGNRCWASVHSPSAHDALNKIADYAKYESNYTKADLLQMLTSLKTVVYLKDFQVAQIAEVQGWDPVTQQIIYKDMVLPYKLRYAA